MPPEPQQSQDQSQQNHQDQHQDHQQPSSATSSILKERRFKLSRACDRCRRRRIKCDEGHPCQACLSANSACTFEEPGKRTHPHKSKRTTTLEDRMQHLESLIQSIPSAVFAAGGTLPPNPLYPQPTPTADGTAPFAPFMYPTSGFQTGVPPPSLHVFPLTNPSTHFKRDSQYDERSRSPMRYLNSPFSTQSTASADQFGDDTSKLSLTASYLYFDDEGYTRWQGETSGLPVLDLLVERHALSNQRKDASPEYAVSDGALKTAADIDWFPDRTPKRTDMNPQILWKLITTSIAPDLMDRLVSQISSLLVQCYLSTTHYLLPCLHIPTFLADYGNPQKWGEPGFAALIVAICCLSSRHVDDPRVRSDPNEGITAGAHWFELYHRLRTLPIADRPTVYTIQANLIAAVYAVGLGRTSRGASLLSEAVTMCIDAGMHRSADTWDLFDPIEDEVRKRTFWSVYIWDKQFGSHFGRPSILRLRDCDVPEPTPVDDEYITKDGIAMPSPGTECRMQVFIMTLRIMVVLESVLDVPPARHTGDLPSSFLLRSTSALLAGKRGVREMREEEAMMDEIRATIPPYWVHSPETLASEDTVRLTQAAKLHCAEHYVRMLIYRHRFSEMVAETTSSGMEGEQSDAERQAMISAHNSALQIVATYVSIAKKGLMTYYGVHVIHQLTQAGRTLVAILLCCKTEALQPLIPTGLDAIRSCMGLLRRFSGRYVCGMRSGDLMEEFCRVTQIPLDPPRPDGSTTTNGSQSSRPPWIRPVRKKGSSISGSNGRSPTHSGEPASHHSSPEAFSPSEFFGEVVNPSSYQGSRPGHGRGQTPPGQGASLFGIDPSSLDVYMSPVDVMASFLVDGGAPGVGIGMSNVGVSINGMGMDVGHLFGPEMKWEQV
ncbi:Fungal specific transcription factor domain containing protein [Amanita muscaria]